MPHTKVVLPRRLSNHPLFKSTENYCTPLIIISNHVVQGLYSSYSLDAMTSNLGYKLYYLSC